MHYNSPLVKVTPSSSCASNAHDDRERKKAKISNEDVTFSLTKERGSFLILVQKSSFRRCWSVLLFHRSKKKKKKNFVERERDVAAEKRERFSFLVETSRTNKTRIITHHHNGSSFFFCDFQRHFSATPLFVSERDNFVRRSRFCSFFSRRGLHVFVVAS